MSRRLLAAVLLTATCGMAQQKPRAGDLGVPFDGIPGPLNAITDVAGVLVGHSTIVRQADQASGQEAVCTGVTAILTRRDSDGGPVFAAWFSLKGNGEMTGTTWIEESGFLEGPIAITNTHSVGVVRDAIIDWQVRNGRMQQNFALPVVAETYDGWLNDINGFHVGPEHAFEALDSAAAGLPAEGSVGGGTGMTCFEFKGGIGTSSRKLADEEGGYLVGALLQANFGRRYQLTVAGVRVGRELDCDAVLPCRPDWPRQQAQRDGSIIIVVATDAPLLPHQLKRLARRASLGVGRTGSISTNGSGDMFLAFSTANPGAATADLASLAMLPNRRLHSVFEAVIQTVEESIVNAMVAAETITGYRGHKSVALPHDDLRRALAKYGRLAE